MKAIFPGLPLLDAGGKELGEGQASGDTQGAVQGFDALLALVAAQSAPHAQLAQPVKPLAPSVGAQAPTALPAQSSANGQASAQLELMAPQVDAAMYSVQGALFASALESAGVTWTAEDAVEALETQVAPDVNAELAPAAQPEGAVQLPELHAEQPSALPVEAPHASLAQPATQSNEATVTASADPQAAAALAEQHSQIEPQSATAAPVLSQAVQPHAPQSTQVADTTSAVVESRPVALEQPAQQAAPEPAASRDLLTPPSAVEQHPAQPQLNAEPASPTPAPRASRETSVESATPAQSAERPVRPESAAQPHSAPVASQPRAAASPSAQPASTLERSAARAQMPAPAPVAPPATDVEPSLAPLQVQSGVATPAPQTAAAAPELETESAPAREPSTREPALDTTVAAASQQPLVMPLASPEPQRANVQQVVAASAPARATSAAAAPAADSADPAANLLGMRDVETGATVTRVEFFQTPASTTSTASGSAPVAAARSQPLAAVDTPAQPQPVQSAPVQPALAPAQVAVAPRPAVSAPAQPAPRAEAQASAPALALEAAPAAVEQAPDQAPAAGSDELEANARPAHDEGSESRDAAPGEQSADGQSADARPQPQPAAPQPAFQPSDAHGMRGLDAIVASLLRTGAQSSEAAPSARGPARIASVQTGKVETAKSDAAKSAEQQSLESGMLRDRVLAREEERQSQREALELEPAHAFRAELKPDAAAGDAPGEAAPAPLPTPVLVQDPDAVLMGKLARGESVNAAAISIDHPDFGAMDLVVENENGRIDVRAVLETPKAAAVMRAQESALRYGIQQAGMTFGALRVRSRGEQPTQLKARDNVKSSRRPGHEWEA